MKVLKETQKIANTVLKQKYGFATFGQFVGIGASKYTTEKLLMKTSVGNSTMKSGVIKSITALGVDFLDYKINGSKRSFIGKSITGGLVVDGIEDMSIKSIPYAINFIKKIFTKN